MIYLTQVALCLVGAALALFVEPSRLSAVLWPLIAAVSGVGSYFWSLSARNCQGDARAAREHLSAAKIFRAIYDGEYTESSK